MTSTPRGYALVINVYNFIEPSLHREGSDRDYKSCKLLLNGLGYKVLNFKNRTAQQIKNLVRKFADMECHENVDSCIVVVSSHGTANDEILGYDCGLVSIEHDIIAPFNNDQCPSLRNKPKMFFIQACRGNEIDMGREVEGNISPTFYIVDLPLLVDRAPNCSDMIIVHSTIAGYVSHLHAGDGSWFVQAVVEILMEHAADTDLEAMLKIVAKMMMQRCSHEEEKQAPEVILRGWVKDLYFNPGFVFQHE